MESRLRHNKNLSTKEDSRIARPETKSRKEKTRWKRLAILGSTSARACESNACCQEAIRTTNEEKETNEVTKVEDQAVEDSSSARTLGSDDSLGSLVEVSNAMVHAVGEAPEWEELDMVVDNGASVTVINNDMVRAV